MAAMKTFARGVIVDVNGYVLAAVQWDASGPRPTLSRTTRAPEYVTFLLDDKATVATYPGGQARWDFKAGAWVEPTERYALVRVTADPDIAALVTTSLVWPARLPNAPEGAQWISTPPPAWRAIKPLWRISSGAWEFPARRAVIDPAGRCVNLILSHDDAAEAARLPAGYSLIAPDKLSAADELGEDREIEIGDLIDDGAGAGPQTLTKAQRKYERFPARIVRRALVKAGRAASFKAFLTARGITDEQIDGLTGIGLGTKIFREWLASENISLQQAQSALIREAENEIEAEAAFEAEQNS